MKKPICDEKRCETPVILQQPDVIPPLVMNKVNTIATGVGCTVDPDQDVKIDGFHSIGYKCDGKIGIKTNHYIENNTPKVDMWIFINDTHFLENPVLPTHVAGKFDGIDFIIHNGDLKGSVTLYEDDFVKENITSWIEKMNHLRNQITQINNDDFVKDFNHIKALADGAKDAHPNKTADLFNTDGLRSDVETLEKTVKDFKTKYKITVTDMYQIDPPIEKKENLLTELGKHLKILG